MTNLRRNDSVNAYSKDLRSRVFAMVDRGIPRKEVAELFGVFLLTIKRWLIRRRVAGDVSTRSLEGIGEWGCLERIADKAVGVQPGPDLERALRGVQGGDGHASIRGHDEPQHRLPFCPMAAQRVADSARARRGNEGSLAMVCGPFRC